MLFEGAVPDFAEAVEEHGAGQCVAGFAFVQAGGDALAQSGVLCPFQDEQGPFEAAVFAQGFREAVLTWVGTKLAEHQGRGDGSGFDGGGQAQDLIPVLFEVFDVDGAADDWFQAVVFGFVRCVDTGGVQVPDPGREAETEEGGQGEDVVGEPCSVGVVL